MTRRDLLFLNLGEWLTLAGILAARVLTRRALIRHQARLTTDTHY